MKNFISNLFDRRVRSYDAWYDENKPAYFSELDALRKALPKKGKGLEIGVGTARFAGPLGIRFGIDSSKKMVEIAKGRGVRAKLGSGENLPFNDGSFDYIAVMNTLCFVKDPVKVLKETRRVLKKNGNLIIGMIDKDSFLGKFYRKKKSVFYRQASFFGVKEVISFLKKVGFSKFSCYQTLYDFPNRIRLPQKSHEGFGKGGFVVINAQQ